MSATSNGATGMGHTTETGLPLTWGGKGDANVLWKVLLPGQEANAGQDQNQSSPVVAGGRVFVTASYWPEGKPDPKAFPEHHVACYRAADVIVVGDAHVTINDRFADGVGSIEAGILNVRQRSDAHTLVVDQQSPVVRARQLGRPRWQHGERHGLQPL